MSEQPRSSTQSPSASSASSTRGSSVCLPTPISRESSWYRYRRLPGVIFGMTTSLGELADAGGTLPYSPIVEVLCAPSLIARLRRFVTVASMPCGA